MTDHFDSFREIVGKFNQLRFAGFFSLLHHSAAYLFLFFGLEFVLGLFGGHYFYHERRLITHSLLLSAGFLALLATWLL